MCGSGGSSTTSGGGSGAPRATVQCPPRTPDPDARYRVECRWLDTEKYCGDDARLEVTCTPTPPDGSVTVEILHPTDSGVLDTLSGNMSGGRMQGSWTAKAHAANWRDAQIPFRGTVTSVGVMNTSSNRFRFRRRPTTDWILVDHDHRCNGGFAPVVELHDARLEQSRVHYSMKLKLTGIGLTAARQTNAKRLVEDTWNNGFASRKFHRVNCRRGSACDCTFDCCKLGFYLDLNFVTSGQHISVEIVAAPAPPAATPASCMGRTGARWYEPPLDEPSVYAHEVGHALGQYDEYAGGGTDPSGTQPAPPPAGQANLMSHGLNTTLLNRHYRRVVQFINDNAGGDNYAVIPP
jgi:hypothetical protein